MNSYNFGLEAEFIVVNNKTFKPLWHMDLKFNDLYKIISQIDVSDLPALDGLELEKPHRAVLPYVVEGYHVPHMDESAEDILPKGLEIRTPVCKTIEECLATFKILYSRLQTALAKEGMILLSLSHHPLYSEFKGPQNKRRHDYWQWAMEVMTTYGPDINVSFPEEIYKKIDNEDLIKKINYYGPALSALSVASPVMNSGLWQDQNNAGLSYRMFKRSYIAPPIEIHPNEKGRYEFKVFDMPKDLMDFEAQFLSFLLLVLDDSLMGRANHQSRIYDLGQVSKLGLEADFVKERLVEFFKNADTVLKAHGFNPLALLKFYNRIETKMTPAHEIRDLFHAHKGNINFLVEDLITQQSTYAK